MTTIIDQTIREAALDPTKSFIVQAPAGSGKTELLTQRFLRLLSKAEKSPEEILTITFTRKAADQMRLRIVNALKAADKNELPTDPHACKTHELAKATLERNNALQWHLLDNPNRLQIQTIDSFCTHIVQRMPILSQLGSRPNLTDDATKLYETAVNNLLSQMDEQTDIAKEIAYLLSHLDNQLHKVKKLFISTLAKRDQWLPHIINKQPREEFEKGLLAISHDTLETIQQLMPDAIINELIKIFRWTEKPLNENRLRIQHLDPESTDQKKAEWLYLINKLLTQKNEWRKTADSKIGFPAVSEIKDKTEKSFIKELKEQFLSCIKMLSTHTALKEAFIALRNSPPLEYTDAQWKTLTALFHLLPRLTAELKLVFREVQHIDFIENTQSALTALSMPTDFRLALDHTIHHILVDEFQDTSSTHLRLLELLTAEWTPDDQRTLFVVGDPMQSIYRFRDADVRLFMRAQHEGIGNIPLIPLHLKVNFRSHSSIIHWINQTFTQVFPEHENIDIGAVPYSECESHHDLTPGNETVINIHPLIDGDTLIEAQKILEIIRTEQNNHPEHSIAILVKARSHLGKIIQTLKQNDIAYQAVEIDTLEENQTIQDLFALTKALLHRGDRIAWLSILRAPWCGLTLKDLHTIAQRSQDKTIWECMTNPFDLGLVSTNGHQRLEHVIKTIQHAFDMQADLPLREWIHQTWKALNGPICIHKHSDLNDAETYFSLLENFEVAGNLLDFEQLKIKTKALFSAPQINTTKNPIQIMTIHKAKGLEFDTVIIPSLEKTTLNNDPDILLWSERPRSHQKTDLILAPIKASDTDTDPIYTYLRQENTTREYYENQRLFYVAVTRTKHQLHLLGKAHYDVDKQTIKTPQKNAFLYAIWPIIYPHYMDALKDVQITKNSYNIIPTKQPNVLYRLPDHYFDSSPSVETTSTTK